ESAALAFAARDFFPFCLLPPRCREEPGTRAGFLGPRRFFNSASVAVGGDLPSISITNTSPSPSGAGACSNHALVLRPRPRTACSIVVVEGAQERKLRSMAFALA